MKIFNPATGQFIKDIEEDTIESISEKIGYSRISQEEWAAKTIDHRIEVIKTFSKLLKSNIELLANDLTSEVGKPVQQAESEIKGAVQRIKFFVEHCKQYLQNETVFEAHGVREMISYEPLGLVCNISAWNYPFLVGVNVFIPALIAGNAVIYKASEFATITGQNIHRLLLEAGVPKNVFQPVIGKGDIGEVLLKSELDGYFFTGSHKTGLHISEMVSHKLVPLQLELGGKDPVYIADDIKDIKSISGSIADGAFYNNGQSCCAIERIYVHESIHDKFVTEFLKHVKKFKVGDPFLEETYLGSLARPQHVDFLQSQVINAKTQGATVEMGGKSPQRGYFSPTVLTNVSHSMSIMKFESFGPIIGIQKVSSDEEAIHLMQDTDYGLTASVFSDNEARANTILKQMKTGTVYWNCSDRVSPYLPWSGRNNSGLGLTLSHLGIRNFTHPKAWHMKM